MTKIRGDKYDRYRFDKKRTLNVSHKNISRHQLRILAGKIDKLTAAPTATEWGGNLNSEKLFPAIVGLLLAALSFIAEAVVLDVVWY